MADSLVIRGADLLDVDAGEVLGGRQLLVADGAVEAVLGEGEATPVTRGGYRWTEQRCPKRL